MISLFKKIAVICLLLFTCALACRAQEAVCALKLTELPQAEELRGFRLGMTLDNVKALVPKLVLGRTDEFGLMKTTVNPDFNRDVNKAAFQGVRTISFEFLDDKLFSLGIAYNDSFKWQRLDDFLPQISKSLHLPMRWQSRGWHGQELDCKDFQAIVRMIGESPSIVLLDKTSKDLLDKRIAEKEEAQP